MTVLIIITSAIIITLLLTRQQEPARIDNNNLTDLVDSLLPQTQCGKCGYPGCRPYAQAIIENKADINQCPPGGRNTIRHIARLLGRELKPLNPEFGRAGPKKVAIIDEAACIGCVKCIKACPVDAIIGAPKQMHTVIEQECTGCELCVEPCPVDCIDMLVYIQGGKRVNPELNSDQIKAGS